MAKWFHITESILKRHGLRVTPRRLAIGSLLSGPRRHIEARALFDEARDAGLNVSLATVYNTLRDFERIGLIRRIALPGERVWFDTDRGDHRHFYIESENRVIDFEDQSQPPGTVPPAPDGYRITRIDMIAHLEKRDRDL